MRGRLVGVDMSAKMLSKARKAGYYDELLHATILDFASDAAPASFDAIVIGDVLVLL